MSILPSMLQRKVLLKITTEDHATEIFVIDGDFQLVERGVGEMSVSLAPGIYNIKLRAGVQTAEKLVVLMGDKAEEELNLGGFEFSSAVPLAKTAKTHEFHIETARSLAGKVDATAGKGSWIYVFARDWTSKERPEKPPPVYNPIRGLSLWGMDGEYVSGLHTGKVSGDDWDPCAACNVEVAPGSYRLRLELPAGGGTVERCVVASPGWQTQVFLMQTDYGRGPESREADLSRGSVLLSPSTSFDPFDPTHRLTELARLALASGRHRVSSELRKSLEQQIENPMLGIYGAHLLLLEPEPDYELLREVVAKLRVLVGTHPDVEAVALKLPDPKLGDYRFESPPMLRRSWACVVEATCDRRDLVPAESLAARISTRLWGDGSWLAWATPPPAETLSQAAEEDAEQPVRSIIQDALAERLQYLQEAARSEKLKPPPVPSAFGRAGEIFNDILQGLFDRLREVLEPLLGAASTPAVKKKYESKEAGEEIASKHSESEDGQRQKSEAPAEQAGPGKILDDEMATKLVRTFGIPRAQIEKLLGDIEKKLGGIDKSS